MTVQEIQDYMQKRIEKYDEIPNEHQDAKFKQATADLVIVLGMLDELEPNTISQAIKVIENEEEKLKFDVDKHQVDSCIFEIRNILGLGAKENNK